MNHDLKIIKKKYGEDLMHFSREFFSTILEEEGTLSKIILDNFYPSHFLYKDIIENDVTGSFINFIYQKYQNHDKKTPIYDKLFTITPSELLATIGYTLYECHTEEDLQKFKKYYAKDELLCTFAGGRLNNYHIFFAVKDNALKLKREDYIYPMRQDEYGTSVISIQFHHTNTHLLSIKNRYNHKVDNCDSTFSNNLDNIVAGLTKAFENTYGLKQKYLNVDLNIPNYVLANDGKYYKYNYEINNIYYCPDNIIISNHEVKKYDKSKYLLIDYYLIDLVNKNIYLYDRGIFDDFISLFSNITNIKIINNQEEKEIYIYLDNLNPIKITIDKENKIKTLFIPNNKTIKDNFMLYNNTLISFKANSLTNIGNNFLRNNHCLISFSAENLKYIANNFLPNSYFLKDFKAPSLIKVSNNFLERIDSLKTLSLPNLKECGSNFLKISSSLVSLNLPIITSIDTESLTKAPLLKELSLPNLKTVKNNFLKIAPELTTFTAPALTHAGSYFLSNTKFLETLITPSLECVGYFSLFESPNLKTIVINSLLNPGNYFLYQTDLLLTNLNHPPTDEKLDIVIEKKKTRRLEK